MLNHKLRQQIIIGDIGIGKSRRVQAFEKIIKLFWRFGFNPDQD
jgi:hypothetical protein